MKTVVILEQEDYKTLCVLLNDAKINLQKCEDITFRLGEGIRKIEEAIEILKEM